METRAKLASRTVRPTLSAVLATLCKQTINKPMLDGANNLCNVCLDASITTGRGQVVRMGVGFAYVIQLQSFFCLPLFRSIGVIGVVKRQSYRVQKKGGFVPVMSPCVISLGNRWGGKWKARKANSEFIQNIACVAAPRCSAINLLDKV